MRCKYCTGENSDAEDNNGGIGKSNHDLDCPNIEEEPCLEETHVPITVVVI